MSMDTQTPQGAAALDTALERDHDGGLLDMLGSVLGGGDAGAAPG